MSSKENQAVGGSLSRMMSRPDINSEEGKPENGWGDWSDWDNSSDFPNWEDSGDGPRITVD